MHRLFISIVFLSLSISSTLANEVAINQNSLPKKVTVKQALSLHDNTNVEIQGYIIKSVGDEKYKFRDDTGIILVDIDDELWAGKSVYTKNLVTLFGEVDIDYSPMKRVEIDVNKIVF